MKTLHKWYIVQGATEKLCCVPIRLLQGREIITEIKCLGILDAVKQLHHYEKAYCPNRGAKMDLEDEQ